MKIIYIFLFLFLVGVQLSLADPCNWHNKEKSETVENRLKPGVLLYGRDVFPSMEVESVLIRPATAKMNEVIVNGVANIDFRSTYVKTDEMEFTNLGSWLGCNLYKKEEMVDFRFRPRFPQVSKPTATMAGYCRGSYEDTRLLTAFEASLYHPLEKPYCVEYQEEFFDPFGFASLSNGNVPKTPPWESVKNLYLIVMVPQTAAKENYTLEIITKTTLVSDSQCVYCYPEVDCSKLTSVKTVVRDDGFTLPVGDKSWKILPLHEIDEMDFESEVNDLVIGTRLKSGGGTIEEKTWDLGWPRCM